MEPKAACRLRASLLIFLTLQQVGGYTYRNRRKFSEDMDWSYAGTLNQNNWAKKFPSCSSAKQSPIDVEESLAQVKLRYQNLRLDGWENPTGQRTAIKNDGKTVALDLDGDFYVSGGGLASEMKAGRVTFHWGRCNASSEGSEHSLDGVKYPLEMQIYCFEPRRFHSFQQSVKAGGRLTALAVLIQAGSEEDNGNFSAIADAIGRVSRYGKSGQVAAFAPRALLPDSTDKYFIYNGSLTTPPCSETVEWIVFKNAVSISPAQLEVFCEVMTMQQAGYVMLMDYLQNNYREQRRNFTGRVFSSYTGTEEILAPACSSEPEKVEAAAYNLSSMLVTWERPRAVYDPPIERYSVSRTPARPDDRDERAPVEYLTDGDQDVGALLDGLAANGSYVVRVAAVCANGLYGRLSAPLAFTVPAEQPGTSLIPDSNEFDYEEENYPPDPRLNESLQREDYNQALVPTKAPATFTWTPGPAQRPPQHGAEAGATEASDVASTPSQHTSSGGPPQVSVRSWSTTPRYANARDPGGAFQPKSSENRGTVAPTEGGFGTKGGRGVPSNGTAPTSSTNKTTSRPITSTATKTAASTANDMRSTFLTVNKTLDEVSDASTEMPTSATANASAKKTAGIAPSTTWPKDMNQSTSATNETETTAIMTPPTNKTATLSWPMTRSRNNTATATMTTVLTSNSSADKTTAFKQPMDKTATVTGPNNKTSNMSTTGNMSWNLTRLGDGVATPSSVHVEPSEGQTALGTADGNGLPDDGRAQVQGELSPGEPTTASIPHFSTTRKISTLNHPMNTTATTARPKNKTTSSTSATRNPTRLDDHIVSPSSVHIHEPDGDLTTPETDDGNKVAGDDGARVQGERGPTTPSVLHFPSAKTSVWRTVPSLSKGERLSVLPLSSSPSSLVMDHLRPSTQLVPSARLHELSPSSAPHSGRIPTSPTSPLHPAAPSVADGQASLSWGDRPQTPELGVLLPEVSLSLGSNPSGGRHAVDTPLPRQDPSSHPTLAFADDLPPFSSGEPAEASGRGASLSFSPTLRPSFLLPSDFPLSAAAPGPTPSFSKQVELLGYGAGSASESFLPELGDGEFSDAMCACSQEPSVAWPHASPRIPLGVSTSLLGVDLPVSSLGVPASSFSGAASGGPVAPFSPSSSAPPFPPAAHAAPTPFSVTAVTFEPAASPPRPPSFPAAPGSADSANGASGSNADQEWDGVQVSGSGQSILPPSAASQSGQTSGDLDDRSSAFYFDSESGSSGGSGRAGAESQSGPPAPSPARPEESGSGLADGLYDNDTSSDFSIPERSQLESEKEEEPVADAGDSSRESRVGSVRSERKALVPLVVVSTLTALGLLVLVAILLYWRMCFQTAHFYVNESASPRPARADAFASDTNAAIPVEDFVRHVAELRRTAGFQRNFELLQESYEEVRACTADAPVTSETAGHPDNKGKNRYSNILAFDHSRVRLCADEDERRRDYINANFVDGFGMRRAYIAAQGPLRSSTDDFWRMIWEQNVGVVVMITNLLEKGRRKCDQYWPSAGREDYGGLAVTLTGVRELAHYTERTFAISDTHVKKAPRRRRSHERALTQYHYTQWPDMGVPEHALPLLSFIRRSSRARTPEMGPLLVHCSAGVGRTGTYLVLDSMLRQMEQEGVLDVDGYLRHVRTQRNHLVQTQEQYEFIHRALAEAILCGDTEVPASRLRAYVERLLTPLRGGADPLDRQLQLLSAEASEAGDHAAAAALLPENRPKNRSGSLLPAERRRVRLSPCAGDASDYINASYVTGYGHSKEFIITQNPLPGTVNDFWRMVWEHDVRIIVALRDPARAQDGDRDRDEAEPCVFWPGKDGSAGRAGLSVAETGRDVICLANEDVLSLHRLALRAAQDDFVAEVRLYRTHRWPGPDGAVGDALPLVRLLRERASAEEGRGPVAVMDREGGAAAATFCALCSLTGQLERDRRLDVFQAAKLSNLARPGSFRTRDGLEFLYKALLSALDDDDDPDGPDPDERRREPPARGSSGSPV